jgi:hypothetical protein
VRWTSSAAASASETRGNAATTLSPSPCSAGRAPPCSAIAASSSSSWRRIAAPIASGVHSRRNVEASTSVSMTVTVPTGG